MFQQLAKIESDFLKNKSWKTKYVPATKSVGQTGLIYFPNKKLIFFCGYVNIFVNYCAVEIQTWNSIST